MTDLHETHTLRAALAAICFSDLRPDFEDGQDIILRWSGNKADWERARAALATPPEPSATADAALPVGAILASALMAANIPCDSGEDVDRLITELYERGYSVQPDRDLRPTADGFPPEEPTTVEGALGALELCLTELHKRPDICGVIWPGGPHGEPLACAWPPNPPGKPMHEHSWSWVPTPEPSATADAGTGRRRWLPGQAREPGLREAATRFVNHVQEVSCDHAPHRRTHTSCPEVLALVAALASEDRT